MKKMMKNSVLQSILFVCTLFAMVLAFGDCAMASEGGDGGGEHNGKKVEKCGFQSVTIRIGDDEPIICDGDLEPIVVDKDVEWSDYLASIQIVDYKIVVNDSCANHTHSKVTGRVYGSQIGEFLTYDSSTERGENTLSKDVVKENDGYYCVYFNSENCDDGIQVYFSKTYNLEFELDGGTVISGELPTSYYSYGNTTLPYVERDGYTFKGWKEDGGGNNVTYINNATGDKKFTAQWEQVESERTEITTDMCTVGSANWTGDECEPDVSVYVSASSSWLKRNVDYKLSYKNNIEMRDKDAENPPTVIITGIGKYKGTVEIPFTISKRYIYFSSSIIYGVSGSKLETVGFDDVMVLNHNKEPVSGTWKWVNPETTIGKDTNYCQAEFTPDDKEYYDVTTTKLRVYGNTNDIGQCDITLDTENFTYTGEEQKPTVTVTKNGISLRKGIDYKIVYKNNVMVGDKDSENAPMVTIAGMGTQYAGTKSVTFTITKGTLKVESVPTATAIEVGNPLSNSTISGGKVTNTLDKEVKGTWSWKEATTVPTIADSGKTAYEVVFTPEDNGYNSIEGQTLSLTVNQKDITDDNVKVEMKDIYSYIGEEVKPSVVVKDGGTILKEQTDYTIAYKNNVNVCDKTATEAPTITITGMGNYAGTKSVTFTIAKGTLKVESVPTVTAIEAGNPLSNSTINGGKVVSASGEEVKGTWSWKEATTVPAVADSETTEYKVVFTPENTNYDTVEVSVTLTVNPKKEDVPKDDTPTPGDKGDGNVPPTTGDKKEDVPQIGTTQRDKDNKAIYTITKSENGSVEVAYKEAVGKTSKVVIPDTVILADGTTAKVTTVAAGAFKGNKKLKKVTVGKNVTSIEEKAFYNCKKLTSVTIPETVKQIGESAFQNCSKLKKITIETKQLTKKTVGKNAFKGIHKKAKFEVPGKKLAAYKKILKAKGAGKKVTYVKISSKK